MTTLLSVSQIMVSQILVSQILVSQILVSAISHIPKVLPIDVEEVDEVAEPQVRVEVNAVFIYMYIVKKLS
jgi:hypothetical protein